MRIPRNEDPKRNYKEFCADPECGARLPLPHPSEYPTKCNTCGAANWLDGLFSHEYYK